MAQTIILATESAYKQSLFKRLNLEFSAKAANVDETPLIDETARNMAGRLAKTKALEIKRVRDTPDQWIIGADQTAQCNEVLVSKPSSHEQAVQDLHQYAGNILDFYTAVYVATPEGEDEHFIDKTSVKFRDLTSDEIENYLRIEKPYDCAGAFKAEGLGISLFEYMTSSDPTALIGLPLIWLGNFLRSQGFNSYSQANKS